MVAADVPTAADIVARAGEIISPERAKLIEGAYSFAAACHEGQQRDSGDPYIVHPIDAALTVADLNLDGATIAAALLHDVVEDCGIANDEIGRRFGDDVARLVEGVTKLSRLSLLRPDDTTWDEAIQADNLRKMFLAMAEDIRVVIIKLADRLHNMRTLDALSRPKQLRIARETMDIYAPLANRLGLGEIARELEDLAFRYLEPAVYGGISRLVDASSESRQRYVVQVEKLLRYELSSQGIEAELTGRAKHNFSIHQKMQKYAEMGKSFNDIYDLMAIRILVESVADCYHVLGLVHGLFRPLPGLFDDYIANPRENVYQSLHTTVMGPGARPLEVQIRTYDMNRTAEYGVAAHWRYKEGGRHDPALRRAHHLGCASSSNGNARPPRPRSSSITSRPTSFATRSSSSHPKAKSKTCPPTPRPSTSPSAFTPTSASTASAPASTAASSPSPTSSTTGDVVEIVTSRSSRGPSRDWLNANLGYVKTGNARSKIRQWFKRQERDENVVRGREMLERELKRLSVAAADLLPELLKWFHFDADDDLYAAIGFGGVSLNQIAGRIGNYLRRDEAEHALQAPAVAAKEPVYTSSIRVLGTGDVLTQIARCCNPVPGDDIIGYVTRARGVTIHRGDCHNVVNSGEQERLVPVEWGQMGQLFPVAVRIEAHDRVGLLRDLSTIAAEDKVNLTAVRTQERGDRTTDVYLTLETTGVEQLSRLLARMEGVRGVFAVSRETDAAAARDIA